MKIKDLLQFALLISGLMTALMWLPFSGMLIGLFFTEHRHDAHSLANLAVGVFGIVGFVGLFLLLLEHKVNKLLIVLLLISGITSLILCLTLSGNHTWNWVIHAEEPGEVVLLVWPSLVALINSIRILIDMLKETPKGKKVTNPQV